jgi:hypothetical protein
MLVTGIAKRSPTVPHWPETAGQSFLHHTPWVVLNRGLDETRNQGSTFPDARLRYRTLVRLAK